MTKRYFHMDTNRNFSIAMVWINGGSNMDGEGKKGINQILCFLLSRGCKGFENLVFSDYINSHGAEFNTELLEDGILISLKSLDEHFEKLFPLIDLTINNPLLLEEQFKIVKKTSLYSIKKDNENPFNIAFEKWRKIVYLNHPYAYNCIGYEEDISKITHQDILLEYESFKNRNKYLISNNSKINGKSFELLSTKDCHKEFDSKSEISNEKRFECTYQNTNQIILMIGNKTCSQKDKEYLPLKVLESHLSYGMSSILFKLFREKNGLTYDVGIFNPTRKNNTPFLIYLSVSNKNALLAFELLSEFWVKLLTSMVSEKEIHLAKEKLKSSFLISNQSIEEIFQRKIQLISYGLKPNFDKDFLSNIKKVNSKDVFEVTNKYLSKPFLSIYGEEKLCKEIESMWKLNF